MKALSKEDLKKLIDSLEQKLVTIKEIGADIDLRSGWKALGYAQGTIEIAIKQLKGDYPIF